MSVLSDEIARRGFPSLQETTGTSATRTPTTGDPVPVTAVFNEYSEDRLAALRPKRELSHGEEIERHALLQVPEALTVAESDEWTVDGLVWQTQRIGSNKNGYREIYLQRNDKKTTRKQAVTRRY